MATHPVSRSRRVTVDELLDDARSALDRVLAPQVLAAVSDGAVLVDIRSDAQRAADGVVPDAVYVPRNILEWRADLQSSHPEPALGGPDTRLILMCNEGYQSSLAAATLQLLGRDATDVIGGFVAWRAAGLPVEPCDDENHVVDPR
jgi:rhodanese-related sulfurtransferase